MDEDKTGWLAMIAAVGAVSLCCGLPLLVAVFGIGAIAAIVQYGLVGLLIAGVLGGGAYWLLRSRRRRNCEQCGNAVPPGVRRSTMPTSQHKRS